MLALDDDRQRYHYLGCYPKTRGRAYPRGDPQLGICTARLALRRRCRAGRRQFASLQLGPRGFKRCLAVTELLLKEAVLLVQLR